MNFENARVAIYSRLKADWDVAYPGVPVEYENNTTVDLNKQVAPFIACDVVYTDGEQLHLGEAAGARYSGAIYLSVWVKESGGTATAAAWLSHLADLFGMKMFGGVNTRAARPLPGRLQAGWYVLAIRVPFWFDDL